MSDHLDVLIIGAGISGIGAAYHLKTRQRQRTFAILEGREAIGGTWDLFRYPGIRSDSDLQTFGYAFKPWTNERAIADAGSILAYLREAVAENDIERHIRFGHRVIRAEWNSEDACWHVDAVITATGEEVHLTASWLFSAAGYYRYDEGYTPDFPGAERFAGTIVHPQHWPEDLEHEGGAAGREAGEPGPSSPFYAGKRVVVIGSGATAVTLIPAMADRVEHITMLQRSPTYVMSMPAKDHIANAMLRVLGPERGHALARRKNIAMQRAIYKGCQRYPGLARRALRAQAKRRLPKGFDVDTHFKPSYEPWDQRLCLVPDGDLFKALSGGRASIVTDRIASFTETGILLESGAHLDADIIVTATGLNIQAFGGAELIVDGREVDMAQTVAYKSCMLSDVPNFSFVFGYTNSSWTLKVDLVCEHLCRLLDELDGAGYDHCVPVNDDPANETSPFIGLSSGYISRGIDRFPRQGSLPSWQVTMSYESDVATLREGAVSDAGLRFGRAASAVAPAPGEQILTR